jgi:hypothetical protein
MAWVLAPFLTAASAAPLPHILAYTTTGAITVSPSIRFGSHGLSWMHNSCSTMLIAVALPECGMARGSQAVVGGDLSAFL